MTAQQPTRPSLRNVQCQILVQTREIKRKSLLALREKAVLRAAAHTPHVFREAISRSSPTEVISEIMSPYLAKGLVEMPICREDSIPYEHLPCFHSVLSDERQNLMPGCSNISTMCISNTRSIRLPFMPLIHPAYPYIPLLHSLRRPPPSSNTKHMQSMLSNIQGCPARRFQGIRRPLPQRNIT